MLCALPKRACGELALPKCDITLTGNFSCNRIKMNKKKEKKMVLWAPFVIAKFIIELKLFRFLTQ